MALLKSSGIKVFSVSIGSNNLENMSKYVNWQYVNFQRCFVGRGTENLVVEDCFERDRRHPLTDPRETSRSVSEMKEWTCSKIDRPDGEIIRDCLRLYTGGTLFRVCYTNSADGSTCICSGELCNGGDAGAVKARGAFLLTAVALAVTQTLL